MRAPTATSPRRGSLRRSPPAGACCRSTSGCRRRASRRAGCRRSRPSPRPLRTRDVRPPTMRSPSATTFGLPAGSPIYSDMEGYSLGERGVHEGRAVVRRRVGERAARARLRRRRLRQRRVDDPRRRRARTPALPDAGWIANWNGVESVFGDPYVSDSVWANHQRVHQYKGGHKETWGGVDDQHRLELRRRPCRRRHPPRRRRRRRRSSRRRARSAPATEGDRDLARRRVRVDRGRDADADDAAARARGYGVQLSVTDPATRRR